MGKIEKKATIEVGDKEVKIQEGRFYHLRFMEKRGISEISNMSDQLLEIRTNYIPIHLFFKSRMLIPVNSILTIKEISKKEYENAKNN